MNAVPRIIHQTWKTKEVPEKWKSCYDQWAEFCKTYNYEHRLWTDEDNRALIETEFLWFLPYYDKYKYNIQRADAIRYFILYKYGGVYCDLDIGPKVERMTEIHDMIQSSCRDATAACAGTFNIEIGWGEELMSNNFMIAIPESEFMTHVWESLQDPAKYFWTRRKNVAYLFYNFRIFFSTGPGVVNDQRVLHMDQVNNIPVPIINSRTEPDCLMQHAQGCSWHNNKQMEHDVSITVTITLLLILIVMVSLLVSLVSLHDTIYHAPKYK